MANRFPLKVLMLVLLSYPASIVQTAGQNRVSYKQRSQNLGILWGKNILDDYESNANATWVNLDIIFQEECRNMSSDNLSYLAKSAAKIFRQCVMKPSGKSADSVFVRFLVPENLAQPFWSARFSSERLAEESTDVQGMLASLLALCADTTSVMFQGRTMLGMLKTGSVIDAYARKEFEMQLQVYAIIASKYIVGNSGAITDMAMILADPSQNCTINPGFRNVKQALRKFDRF